MSCIIGIHWLGISVMFWSSYNMIAKFSLCKPWQHMDSGGTNPRIFNLGARWRKVISFTPLPLHLHRNNPPFPLNKKLGGSCGLSWPVLSFADRTAICRSSSLQSRHYTDAYLLLPSGAKDLSLVQNAQTSSRLQQISYSVINEGWIFVQSPQIVRSPPSSVEVMNG
jgi:hypothetical protein